MDSNKAYFKNGVSKIQKNKFSQPLFLVCNSRLTLICTNSLGDKKINFFDFYPQFNFLIKVLTCKAIVPICQ